MSKDDCKHGVIGQVKYRKRAIKIKWTDVEYHVQDDADVAPKYVRIYCDTNLSSIVLIGQFWAHITIGISFTYHQNQHLLRVLMRYIMFFLTT